MEDTSIGCFPELNFPESILIRGNTFDGYSHIPKGSSFITTVMQIEQFDKKLKFLYEGNSIQKKNGKDVKGATYLLFYMEKVRGEEGGEGSLPPDWVDVYSLDECIAFKELFINILRCSIIQMGKPGHLPEGLVYEFLTLLISPKNSLQFYLVEGLVPDGGIWDMKNVIKYRERSSYKGEITDRFIKGRMSVHSEFVPHLSIIDDENKWFKKLGPQGLKIPLGRGGKTKKSKKKRRSKQRRSKR